MVGGAWAASAKASASAAKAPAPEAPLALIGSALKSIRCQSSLKSSDCGKASASTAKAPAPEAPLRWGKASASTAPAPEAPLALAPCTSGVTQVSDVPMLRSVVDEVLQYASCICVDVEAGPREPHRHEQTHGKICLLQLRAGGSNEVYLVDLHTLLQGADTAAVQSIRNILARLLSERGPLKLLWDVRKDAEALHRELDVVLGNFIDIQVLEGANVWRRWGIRRRLGLSAAMARYLPDLEEPEAHVEIARAMKQGWKRWDERPLSMDMIEYATYDVQHLDALYEVLRTTILSDVHEAAFRLGLQYVEAFTARPRRFNVDEHAGTFNEDLIVYFVGQPGVCLHCGEQGHEPWKCPHADGHQRMAYESAEAQAAMYQQQQGMRSHLSWPSSAAEPWRPSSAAEPWHQEPSQESRHRAGPATTEEGRTAVAWRANARSAAATANEPVRRGQRLVNQFVSDIDPDLSYVKGVAVQLQ